jgi:hypothetical protein
MTWYMACRHINPLKQEYFSRSLAGCWGVLTGYYTRPNIAYASLCNNFVVLLSLMLDYFTCAITECVTETSSTPLQYNWGKIIYLWVGECWWLMVKDATEVSYIQALIKVHTHRTRFGNATRIFSFQSHLTLIFFNVFQIFGTT